MSRSGRRAMQIAKGILPAKFFNSFGNLFPGVRKPEQAVASLPRKEKLCIVCETAHRSNNSFCSKQCCIKYRQIDTQTGTALHLKENRQSP